MTTLPGTDSDPKDLERLSLTEIWTRGCLGEALSSHDQQHFVQMARNRFWTFRMSLSHALQTRKGDDQEAWVTPLINGLVTELHEGPGLERLWYESEFSRDLAGARVNQALAQRQLQK